ncbi:MAG: glycoside hydrolase family 26 protein [Elusimicrobia bacterium]|nr:glycoside hydrolase family 26 protein [Candidatus Liberimonas magnetica]
MKYFYVILTLFLLIYPFMASTAGDRSSKFEPGDDKVLLFIGQDNKTIDKYISSVKIVPAGFMLYTSIQSMEGLDSKSPDYGSGTMYAEELIRKYPNTMLQIGLYMVDALNDTYSGIYDDNIDKLAVWLNKVKIPVFLRIGYEFDGSHNHYDPEDYIKAYRYLVNRLRGLKVNNVAYVWHSNACRLKPILESYYPGEEYVDWVGITYFNQPACLIDPVITFAKGRGKPVIVAEGTPKNIGTIGGKASWNIWYGPFFSYVNKNKIKAISYINSDWDRMPMYKGQYWKDARVQSNKYIKDFWISEIQKQTYLKSSDGLFEQLNYTNK